MKEIFLSFDGVASGGNDSIPKTGSGSVWNPAVTEAHYNNRKIFSSISELLLIETAQSPQGKPYIYYQYLRYKGVMDTMKRPDSVFAVNIATDTFYPDAATMFSLCRDIFRRCVVGGGILSMDADGTITWVMSSFAGADNVLLDAENKVVDIVTAYNDTGMLGDVAIGGWQSSAPLSLNNETQLLVRINPSDVNPNELASLVKAGKKVAISSEFPTKSAEKLVNNAKAAQQKAESEATSLSGRLDDAENRIASLSGTIADNKSEIESLKRQLKEANASGGKKERMHKAEMEKLRQQLSESQKLRAAEIKKYEAQGNYSCQQQLDMITDRLNDMDKPDSKKSGLANFPVPQVVIGGLAALLIILCGVLLGRCTVSHEEKPEKEKSEQAEYGEKDSSNTDWGNSAFSTEYKIHDDFYNNIDEIDPMGLDKSDHAIYDEIMEDGQISNEEMTQWKMLVIKYRNNKRTR